MKTKISLFLISCVFCLLQLEVNSLKNKFISTCGYYQSNIVWALDTIAFVCSDHMNPINYFDSSDAFKCSNLSDIKYERLAGTMSFLNCQMSRIKYNISGSFTNLHTLDISRTELRLLPNDFFKGSTRLTKLIASRNRLIRVSRSQFEFAPKLKHIDFSFNKIYEIDDGAFMESQFVEEIILSHNKLKSIEKMIFDHLSKLQILDLSFNEIHTIAAESFGNLSALEELNLSHNSLSTIGIGTFSELIVLSSLDLSHNNLSSLGTETFSELKQLVSLDLSRNCITNIDFRGIFSVFKGLEIVYLNGNQLTDLDGFEELTDLDSWSLTDNKFKCDYLQKFFDKFQNNRSDARFKINSLNIHGVTCEIKYENMFVDIAITEATDVSAHITPTDG